MKGFFLNTDESVIEWDGLKIRQFRTTEGDFEYEYAFGEHQIDLDKIPDLQTVIQTESDKRTAQNDDDERDQEAQLSQVIFDFIANHSGQ